MTASEGGSAERHLRRIGRGVHLRLPLGTATTPIRRRGNRSPPAAFSHLPDGAGGKGSPCVDRANTGWRRAASSCALRFALPISASGTGSIDTNEMNYSPRAREIYGFTPDEAVTFEKVRDATHPEDLVRTSALARLALDPSIRSSEPYEYRVRRADTGEERWVMAHGEAIFEEIGRRYPGGKISRDDRGHHRPQGDRDRPAGERAAPAAGAGGGAHGGVGTRPRDRRPDQFARAQPHLRAAARQPADAR